MCNFVPMCSNVFKTCSNMFQFCSNMFQFCSNVFRCVQMSPKLVQNFFKCDSMCSNVFKCVENLFKCVDFGCYKWLLAVMSGYQVFVFLFCLENAILTTSPP